MTKTGSQADPIVADAVQRDRWEVCAAETAFLSHSVKRKSEANSKLHSELLCLTRSAYSRPARWESAFVGRRKRAVYHGDHPAPASDFDPDIYTPFEISYS